jgi:hypothetical protein
MDIGKIKGYKFYCPYYSLRLLRLATKFLESDQTSGSGVQSFKRLFLRKIKFRMLLGNFINYGTNGCGLYFEAHKYFM